MLSPTNPPTPPSHDLDLAVFGAIPSGLSGRLVGIDRGRVVHTVQVGEQRVSYGGHFVPTSAVVQQLVVFGGSVLAFGEGSPAYELNAEIDTLTRVDLAGHGRVISASPKHDPATGALHLIARDRQLRQAHVVVSAGALTRRSRAIVDAPSRIHDLALTRDRVALIAGGFVGLLSREGEARTSWIATGVDAPYPVHAHDAGDAVVLLVLTPLLERWTLEPGTRTIYRDVLDPTPRRFAHCGGVDVEGAQRTLWTTGAATIGHHDLATSSHLHHNLQPYVPGDLVFVTDPASVALSDDGWLVGFVHDTSESTTEFRVIDVSAIAGSPIATIRIPRRVPRGLRCTWIPAAQQ